MHFHEKSLQTSNQLLSCQAQTIQHNDGICTHNLWLSRVRGKGGETTLQISCRQKCISELALQIFKYCHSIYKYAYFQAHYKDNHAVRPKCEKLEDHMTLGVSFSNLRIKMVPKHSKQNFSLE